MKGIEGSTLGRYELRRRVAQGGMSEVYLAYDEEADRDVAIKVVNSHYVDVVERLAIVAVGHAQDPAGVVTHEDRHAHERVGAVRARPGLDRRARHVTHQERAPRRCDEPDDTFARLHAYAPHHVVREADGSCDHKVGGVVLAQEQRRALATNKFRGDLEYRVEQILCPSLALTVHQSPIPRRPRSRSQKRPLVRFGLSAVSCLADAAASNGSYREPVKDVAGVTYRAPSGSGVRSSRLQAPAAWSAAPTPMRAPM